MKIEILMPGKIQDKPYQKLIDLYLERCSNRLPVEIINCRTQDELVKRINGRESIRALDEHAKSPDTNGFVKYDTAAANTEKGNVLVASDFGKGATKTGLTTVVFDDDNYVYAKLTIRVWLEGWDADCINAILEKNTVINLGLSAE